MKSIYQRLELAAAGAMVLSESEWYMIDLEMLQLPAYIKPKWHDRIKLAKIMQKEIESGRRQLTVV